MDFKTVAVSATGMMGRLGPADDPQEAVAGAQLFVESILESLPLKQQYFQKLDEAIASRLLALLRDCRKVPALVRKDVPEILTAGCYRCSMAHNTPELL